MRLDQEPESVTDHGVIVGDEDAYRSRIPDFGFRIHFCFRAVLMDETTIERISSAS
jgi:hypothetical protein